VPALPLELWALHTTADTINRTYTEGYLSAAVSIIEMIRCGVTSAIDHLGGSAESIEGAIAAYRDIGMRVALAPMISDLRPHQTYSSVYLIPPSLLTRLNGTDVASLDETTELAEDLIARHDDPSGLVRIFVGPSGPQRSTAALLRASAELAQKYATGFHTHLLESPIQAFNQSAKGSPSLVQILERIGALGAGFSGAHAVWVDREDVSILASAGATVVNNPMSNLFLGNGIAPFNAWSAAGVYQAVGTDGANCGGNLRVMDSIRLNSVLQHVGTTDPDNWTSGGHALLSSYRGGAHAMMSDDQIGRIEVGREADLVIVDASQACYAAAGDLVEILVGSFESSHVVHVVVGGEFVLRDRKFTRIDELQIIAEAGQVAQSLTFRNSPARQDADDQRTLLNRLYAEATTKFPPRYRQEIVR
jgi:cytosine/adenosine deaminase-related metal-dependent hydrolase